MIFTKYYAYTSDDQVEKLTREFNINHRACIASLIYLSSKIVYLSFSVQKLAKFSLNPGKVHFDVLVQLLRYIWYNKNLGLKYCADMKGSPYLTCWDKIILRLRKSWQPSMIVIVNIVHTLKKLQKHILYFINVLQLTMSHMLQEQFLNQFQKVITMRNAPQEWL